jgi:PAS domain S-box-containing protein
MAVSILPERRFIDVNSAFLRVLGYSADEIIGKTRAELGLFVNPDQRQVIAMLKEFGRIHEVELQVKTKEGAIRDGLFSGEIIESQGKRYFLSVMIDITDRKQAEAERQKTIQELRLALAEVKTLRGVVPICANCKRIRDDRGYWEQVESYVSSHTEALFTHSICPACIQKLYPEFCRDEDSGTAKKE